MTSEYGLGQRILPFSLTMALVLAGCETVPIDAGSGAGGGAPLTPAEQRLRQQSVPFDAKTSLQGCVAGAAVGALLGMLSEGKRSNNMAIGAAAGCAAGFAVNAYVQSRRQQYLNNEMRITAMTADVRADNQRIAALIATSEEVIAADRKRLAEVDAAYKKKAISTEQARRDLARVKANRDHLQQTVDSLRKRENDWVAVARQERQVGANTAPLDQEIHTLQTRVSGLQKEVALMDRQIKASPVAG